MFNYLMLANSTALTDVKDIDSAPTTPAYFRSGTLAWTAAPSAPAIAVVADKYAVGATPAISAASVGIAYQPQDMIAVTGGTYAKNIIGANHYTEVSNVRISGSIYGTTNADFDHCTITLNCVYSEKSIMSCWIMDGGAAHHNRSITMHLNGCTCTGSNANVYSGGYVYGNNKALPETPNYILDRAELVLNDCYMATNERIAGGAHARERAYALVKEVSIIVNGGTYGRIHGGGFPAANSYSEVEHVSMEINSGTIQYIYAGGSMETGAVGTLTGSVDIILNSAVNVTYVYLGARYAPSKVAGDVTLTITGEGTANIRRITGWGSTGMDSSYDYDNAIDLGKSIVHLTTSLSVDYYDYIDYTIIESGCKLSATVVELGDPTVEYEHAQTPELELRFDTANPPAEWVVLAGAGAPTLLAAFTGYYINGVPVVRDETTGALGDTGFALVINGNNVTLTTV